MASLFSRVLLFAILMFFALLAFLYIYLDVCLSIYITALVVDFLWDVDGSCNNIVDTSFLPGNTSFPLTQRGELLCRGGATDDV